MARWKRGAVDFAGIDFIDGDITGPRSDVYVTAEHALPGALKCALNIYSEPQSGTHRCQVSQISLTISSIKRVSWPSIVDDRSLSLSLSLDYVFIYISARSRKRQSAILCRSNWNFTVNGEFHYSQNCAERKEHVRYRCSSCVEQLAKHFCKYIININVLCEKCDILKLCWHHRDYIYIILYYIVLYYMRIYFTIIRMYCVLYILWLYIKYIM